MTNPDRRRELTSEYKQTRHEAAVYRLRNTQTGRALLGTTLNLQAFENRVAFARRMGGSGSLDYRLRPDIAQYGIDAFALEVLERVTPEADQSDSNVQTELDSLLALHREQSDPTLLY